MLFLALGLIGAFSLTRLNIDMFPEIDPPVVSILTSWPGASASDVETEVTEPIEDQVNTVNNLDTLTSKSMDNLSVIACKLISAISWTSPVGSCRMMWKSPFYLSSAVPRPRSCL